MRYKDDFNGSESLFVNEDRKYFIRVVSGNLEKFDFYASQYEESFHLYTNDLPKTGDYIGGHFGGGDAYGHFIKRVNAVCIHFMAIFIFI